MQSTWTMVSVRVASSTLPVESLVALVGVQPTRQARAGERVSARSSAIHDAGFCIYESPVGSEIAPCEHVAWAVGLLRTCQDKLIALADMTQIDVRLSLSVALGQSTLAIDPEDLILLGELGVRLNIDVYPPEEESE